MFYEAKLAWRNTTARPVQTVVSVLVVALAIGLFVAISHLNDGLQRGIIRASDPFGVLVVGAKGSAQQLVLSTLLLQGTPVGNIPAAVADQLQRDARVQLVVPLAMGDNIGGARIVGTDSNFFELRPSAQAEASFRLAQGRGFAADFEAVLGSTAAAALGLALGDQFHPAHGVEAGLEDDTHGARHTIVGILAPSGTSFDNAVLTTVGSVQQVHAEGADAQAEPAEEPQLTAILIKPTGFVEANELWREFYVGTEAQAVFPGAELGALFDLLNQGQRLLQAAAALAALMAALTLFLAIYGAVGARERLLAIMRAVGASRRSIFRLVLLEAILVALLGTLLGRLIGWGVASGLAARMANQTAIPVEIAYLGRLEPLLWLAPLLLGLVAGALPALQAYRAHVVDRLYPG